MTERCRWCGTDPLYVAYHDTEWGVPERDPRALWEKLVLDGFQAGLSWITILKKRDNVRRAFDGFDPERVARWTETDIARALADPGIVRHRGKIEATVNGARHCLQIEQTGSFSDLIWGFVDGRTRANRWSRIGDVPTRTPESEAMTKELNRIGFRFCGPVITYAFMQATGLVNDHLVTCPRHAELS